MPIAPVGQAGIAGGNNASPIAVTYTSAGGNTLIITGHFYDLDTGNFVAPTGVTDTAGNTWHVSGTSAQAPFTAYGAVPPTCSLTDPSDGASAHGCNWVAWCIGAAPVTSVTITFEASAWCRICLSEWSGIVQFDNSWAGGSLVAASTAPLGPVLLNVPGELVIGIVDFGGTSSISPPAGWTALTGQGSTGEAGYLLAGSATGPLSPVWSDGADSGSWVGALAVFSPVPLPTSAPLPPSPPPGFLSPAAFAFPPPFQPANDVPFPPGSPYLIGTANTANSTTVPIKVQNPSNQGDTICITVAVAGGTAPLSVTDTQGNSYFRYTTQRPANNGVVHFFAVGAKPLGNADTITVNNQGNQYAAAAATGCPAAALGAAGYLAPFYYLSQAQTGTATTIPSNNSSPLTAVFDQPVLLMLAINASTPFGAGFLQNSSGYGAWNVMTTVTGALTQIESQALIVAWKVIPGLALNQVIASITSPGGGLLFTVLAPETRFAAGPGQILPPPSPPGFLSPAVMPFQPVSPQVVNDVPVANAPYLIGQAAGTSSSYTLKVQTRTNPGDLILVSVIANSSGASALAACTDTQGNTYQTTSGPDGPQQLAAVNPIPLGPSDSLTVTIIASGFGGRSAVVAVGIPAALGAPGTAFLAPDLGNATGAGSSFSILTTPAGVPVPAGELIFAAVLGEGTAGGGANLPQLPQGWNVIAGVLANSGSFPEFAIVAWKRNTTQIPAGSTVISTIQATGNATTQLAYTTLMAETRFAPVGPHPEMPPGMQSPGAFLLQPALGAPFGAHYNPGPNKWTAAYPVTVSGTPALTRQVEPRYTATAGTTGTLTRQIKPKYTATVATTGTLTRQVQRALLATATTAGTITRATTRTLTATANTTGNLARSISRTLTATASTTGSMARQLGRRCTAAVTTSGALTRNTDRQLPATTVTTTGTLQRAISRPLTATLTTAGTLTRAAKRTYTATVTATVSVILRGPPRLFSVVAARQQWAVTAARQLWSVIAARNSGPQ